MADRLDMRAALNELAFRQSGYFTAVQARDAGYTPQAQKYHADRGNWVRVQRGLYRLAKWPSGELDSFTLWYVWGETAGVLSHESAAAIHGIGDLDPRQVHLTLASPQRTSLPGVRLHVAQLAEGDISQHELFRVTSPARTLLDLADSDVTQEQFTELLSDAIDRDLASRSALAARADDFGSRAALRIERALSSYRDRQE